MQSPSGSLASLTGLRWWAAFAVFLFHMSAFAPLPIEGLLGFGNYGVMFFFVLSGFVLSWSWKPTVSVRAFYTRRIGRIWPAAMVALILAIPVFYSFSPDPTQWWVKDFDPAILLLSVPLIQGWWLAPVILFSGNPAAWTLTCEFFFYALHPILQRGLIRSTSAIVAGFIVTVVVVMVVVTSGCFVGGPGTCTTLPLPLSTLPEFFLGMGIGVLAKRGLLLKVNPWIFIGALAIVIAAISFGPSLSFPSHLLALANAFATPIILSLIVLIIAAVGSRDIRSLRTGFKTPWLVKLGEVSFAFYLVHATVMYVFISVFGQQQIGWHNVVWYLPVLIVGVGLAFTLHTWVEKPFEKKFRRLSARF